MGGALVLALALLTFHRSAVWQSERTLWASERPTPRMTANLGAALINDGDFIGAEQWLMLGLRLSANPNLSERDQRLGHAANAANLAILYALEGREIDARLVAQDVKQTFPTWPMGIVLCEELAC